MTARVGPSKGVKKGVTSAGVQRQYSGTAGRTENCRSGVFAAYATTLGRALVDRELYLPKSWTEDRTRCRAAKVPDEREFATKGELARRIVLRSLASPLPVARVSADCAYGQESRFRRLPAVVEFDYQGEVPHRMRWALARRSLSKPDEIAYYLAYAPLSATVQELVRVARTRWAIEACFQAAKNECGMDQYEVRRYVGWYRHITLAMLAHAFLAATAHQAREKGVAPVRQSGQSGSPWRRFGDSWQLVVPGPRTCAGTEADVTH